MKKYIIATTALLVVATSAFSQGLVNFSAGTSVATRMSTNSVVGGPSTGTTAATSGLYYYALFASASQANVNGNTTAISGQNANYVFNNLGTGVPSTGWELVGIGTNWASAGRLFPASQGTSSAGQTALNADNSLTVQGIGGAAVANLVAVGWYSPGIGTDLASLESWYAAGANNGWIGQSAVANLTLGDGGLVVTPNVFGTGAGQVGGFMMGLSVVPEPTTLALAALGGASLLLFRRKK
ncbi:MAG TPA: hypothetical protein DCQ92_00830 [Verrucomicrobia subdivision 3 bacterium]|nr:hypothetical protein [Limisphaerales bacterium]